MVQMPSDGGYKGPFINSERSTQLSQGCCFILKEGQRRLRKPKIIVIRPWIRNIQVPTITEVLECSTHTCTLSENFSSHLYPEEILTDACNVVFGLMIWKLSCLSTVTSGAS